VSWLATLFFSGKADHQMGGEGQLLLSVKRGRLIYREIPPSPDGEVIFLGEDLNFRHGEGEILYQRVKTNPYAERKGKGRKVNSVSSTESVPLCRVEEIKVHEMAHSVKKASPCR